MAKKRIPFDEMKKIYENWSNYSKQGSQADVFKREGWSRTAYFNECYYQRFPDERPAPKIQEQPVVQDEPTWKKMPKI